MARPDFRMFAASCTGMSARDYPAGILTVGSPIINAPAFVAGWYMLRNRIHELAKAETDRRVGSGANRVQ